MEHLQVRSDGETLGIFNFRINPTGTLSVINSTPTQTCSVTDRMLLSVWIDAALVLWPSNVLINSTPNPTLLGNGSDLVECWDGCCSCLRTDKVFNQLHPNPTLLGTDRMLLSVGMDAALVLGPSNVLINSTPTQPC